MSWEGIELRRKVDTIVIHHTGTPPGKYIPVFQIREWHIERGYADIGYHEVIQPGGKIEAGRDRNKIGAHVKGQNTGKIGIALVGDGREGFDEGMHKALKLLLVHYRKMIPGVRIVGHRDLAATICPGFDVAEWLRKNGL